MSLPALRNPYAKLDTTIRTAYGIPNAADLVALNHDLADEDKSGQKIPPPGLALPRRLLLHLSRTFASQ